MFDERTYEHKCISAFRDEQFAQFGPEITSAQRALVDHTAWLHLNCKLMEGRLAADLLTEHDIKSFLAWQNVLRRNLVELDRMRAANASAKPRQTIQEYFTQMQTERDMRTQSDAAD